MLADKPGTLSMTEYWQSIQSHVIELGDIHREVFNHPHASEVKKIYDEAIDICKIGLQLESQSWLWLASNGPKIKTWSKALIVTVQGLQIPPTDDPSLKKAFPKLMTAFLAMYLSHLEIYRHARVVPTSKVIRARNQKYIDEAKEDFEVFQAFHINWVESCNTMEGDVRQHAAISPGEESEFHGNCCLSKTCAFWTAYDRYKEKYQLNSPHLAEAEDTDTMASDAQQYKRN